MIHAHVAIVGPTMCGKTTLAKEVARQYRTAGRGVLVLDPFADTWPANWQTTNLDAFLAKARASRGCALFGDEAGQVIARGPKAEWLFTGSRHWGHRFHVLAQSGVQMTPLMRSQCSRIYLFRVSLNVAKMWAEDFADDRLLEAVSLSQYEFLLCDRFGGCVRSRLDLTPKRTAVPA